MGPLAGQLGYAADASINSLAAAKVRLLRIGLKHVRPSAREGQVAGARPFWGVHKWATSSLARVSPAAGLSAGARLSIILAIPDGSRVIF